MGKPENVIWENLKMSWEKLKTSWENQKTSWENVSSEICDQVRRKSACSTTEASENLGILDTATTDIILSRRC